ncbi:rhomboid family intramembrane serine protease [Streptomyces sp. CNQ085]|uniref:rhomboid family intramembrane serine protease n=1 Tax=Streptomyces sp. CNQ085 TaxID=2886944 RepID=UPI001F50BCFF|nr:rhomboid family intramembrane serine protease [Streptomyces sp. CNQ085]MCI0384095.1 rhomboid family intramembrane serine protease [Streptomyces sp. CNQ085]
MVYGPTAGASRPSRASRAMSAGVLMASWVALLWVLEAVDVATGNSLDPYGISPRETDELADVVPAAFLHFGWDHVAANSLPLLVLGFLAAVRGIGRFLAVCLTIIVVSGLGVWLTAPENSLTAGASGVVFGLFGYLLVRGFVDRDALDITVGITVVLLYGSILWGVLPTAQGVSWQGHLFGLIGGVLAAFWFRRSAPVSRVRRQIP